ncbi:M1 family aminopeptidase [Ornithobacterium rhinotracheale]|nr:M1 family aminopeptidase [Ornithobacterium rhinotracheale]
MLTFFSEKFGYEYPWDKYSQMVVRDFVTGAMENTTAVSRYDGSLKTW